MPILVILILALIIGLIIANLYNSLIRKKNQVDNAFSSIDVLLKKRHDLLPNLVATVQTYMNFEKNLISEVTELRSRAGSGMTSEKDRIDIENKISKTVGSILATAEN
jgi:LemA protein